MQFSKSSIFIALAALTRLTMGATDHATFIDQKTPFLAYNVKYTSQTINCNDNKKWLGPLLCPWVSTSSRLDAVGQTTRAGIIELKHRRLLFKEYHGNQMHGAHASILLSAVRDVSSKIVDNGGYEFTIKAAKRLMTNDFTEPVKSELSFIIPGTMNASRFHALLEKQIVQHNRKSLGAFDEKLVNQMMQTLQTVKGHHPISEADLAINQIVNKKKLQKRFGSGKDTGKIHFMLTDLQALPRLFVEIKGKKICFLDLGSSQVLPTVIEPMDNGAQKITLREWKASGELKHIEFFIAPEQAAIMNEIFQIATGVTKTKKSINTIFKFNTEELEKRVSEIRAEFPVIPDLPKGLGALPAALPFNIGHVPKRKGAMVSEEKKTESSGAPSSEENPKAAPKNQES